MQISITLNNLNKSIEKISESLFTFFILPALCIELMQYEENIVYEYSHFD